MHSCASSKIRESRPEHLGCLCSSKCSAALVRGIKCENKNPANHRRQLKPTAHRSYNNRLSTSKPCYYCGIHVNLDHEKNAVLRPQPSHPPFWEAGCLGAENVKLLCHVPSLSESGHQEEWQAERQARLHNGKRRGWPCLLPMWMFLSGPILIDKIQNSCTSNGCNLNGCIDLKHIHTAWFEEVNTDRTKSMNHVMNLEWTLIINPLCCGTVE